MPRMSVLSLWRLLLLSTSVLVIVVGMARTPVSAGTAEPTSTPGSSSGTVSGTVEPRPAERKTDRKADRKADRKGKKDGKKKGKGRKGKNGGKGGGKGGTGTPTSTPTATPTATPTSSPTVSPTVAPTSSPTVAPTEAPTPTAAPSTTPAATPSATPTATATATPSATPTATASPSPTPTATASPSATPTATATATPTTPPTEPTTTPPTEPGPTVFHVDPLDGSDSADGTTPATAWRTLTRASDATLAPGEVLRLRAGAVHVGALVLSESGTAEDPIRVGSYGEGSPPLVSTGPCVVLQGDRIEVSGIHADSCGRAGFRVEGDDVVLHGVEASGSVAGIWIREGSQRATVAASYVHDNTLMAPNTPGPDDDYGAFGIEVNGDHSRVVGNRISGHHAPSPDYRVDGAAVEVYQAVGTLIEGNTSTDDLAFAELGGSRTAGTRVLGNTVTSAAEEGTFLMTRGPGQVWGPVVDTVASGNTVRLTGAKSYGFGCYGACTPAHLVLSDNDISAGWYVGWVDGTFTSTDNRYAGELWFPLGAGDTWRP